MWFVFEIISKFCLLDFVSLQITNNKKQTNVNFSWVIYLFISWLEVAHRMYARFPDWGWHLNTNGFPRELSGATTAPSSCTDNKGCLLPSSYNNHFIKVKHLFMFLFFCFYINSPTYPFVFVVVKAAVMCENKPPLPPAFNQTRLGTLVKVTTTWGSGCVRTSSNVWSNGQH